MSTEKIPVIKRLVSRMILVGILPTVILLGAIIALNARRGYRAAIDELEANLRAEVALAAAEIEDGNNNAVLTAQRMAEAQMAGMFGDRAASLAYARAVLAASPALTAAYVCYEPDADGADTASLAEENDLPAAAMDATGRFIPYWFIDPSKGGSIELEPTVDMETSLYYRGVKDEFALTGKPTAMVTEPYEYEGKMIVEQTFPIVIDGAFKGVAGVDRALTDLERDLVRLASRMEANAALISGRGKFIAVSIDGSDVGEELQTQATSDTAFASLVATLRADPRDVFVTTGDGPLTGEPHYFAVAGIPTGDWMLVMGRSRSDVLAPITTQLVRSLILAVVGLLIITVILLGGAIYVTRRINLGVDAATRVASGDLTGDQSPSAGGDETAALLRALGAMTTNLNGLVGQVKQSSIQLNSTATEVAATSREQDATAKSFGAATSQIAAAAKQISATSGELARTIEDVDHVASGTAGLASAGRTDLDTMQSTMHGLDDATRSIADKLAVINEKASRITGVVTTINKVAEQTNLLSVNAAIEAEKAGEYGQGFLVVAREIRRLADQTGAATLDIEQMVQQMQSSVSTGVMEMDRFADQVRHVVANVGQISSQMGEILENVNSNSASFKQVNEGMRSQSLGAQQISEAMGQLTTDAQRTSAAVREYGQAAEQLHDAVAKLRSSISSFRLRSE